MMYRQYIIFTLFFVLCFTGFASGEQKTSPTATDPAQISQPQGQVEMRDVYDIKPLETSGIDPSLKKTIFYTGLILLSLSLIAIALFLYFKKRKKKHDVIVIDPPDVSAMILLDEIEDLYKSDQKAFYFKLTGITKGYISRRFSVDALEKTTEELTLLIKPMDLVPDLKSKLISFFRSCEPVKFADQKADPVKPHEDFTFIKEFIEKTKTEQDGNPDLNVQTG